MIALLRKNKMNKNYILIVIAFITIAIFGPLVGETVTEKRMMKMVEKLVAAQNLERDRLKKINEAHVEVIRSYEKMTNIKILRVAE